MRQGRSLTQRFRRFSGALAFVAPLALYLACAYRDVAYWDVGEMDTVPYILGIAHPPGLPLYTLLGWAFTHLVPIGSVAFRMSALSALAMSCVVFIVYVLVRRFGGDVPSALTAAGLFAVGSIAWSVATRADVHAVESCAFAVTVWLFVRWYDSERPRDLAIAAAAFGLAVAVHPIGLMMLPGILALVIARLATTEPADLVRASLVAVAVCAVWFIYLPLRSAVVTAAHLDPVATLGLPGNAFWDYDHPVVFSNLLALISGSDLSVRGTMQFGVLARVFAEATPIGALLTLCGAIVFARTHRTLTVALGAFCVPSALFACGFPDESDLARYFLPLAIVSAVFAGIGLAWLRTTRVAIPASILAVAPIVWLVATQRHFFDQPHDLRARNEVREVLANTPPNAILVSTWTLAPSLAYTDYVEHETDDRTVVPAWYGDVEDRLADWNASGRPVYVVGTPEGSVAGFRLERLPTHTLLYYVVRQ